MLTLLNPVIAYFESLPYTAKVPTSAGWQWDGRDIHVDILVGRVHATYGFFHKRVTTGDGYVNRIGDMPLMKSHLNRSGRSEEIFHSEICLVPSTGHLLQRIRTVTEPRARSCAVFLPVIVRV